MLLAAWSRVGRGQWAQLWSVHSGLKAHGTEDRGGVAGACRGLRVPPRRAPLATTQGKGKILPTCHLSRFPFQGSCGGIWLTSSEDHVFGNCRLTASGKQNTKWANAIFYTIKIWSMHLKNSVFL